MFTHENGHIEMHSSVKICEKLELAYIVSHKNVTCDRQSDSRWTSKSPTWLVCHEHELVLSWVALSHISDSQSADVVFTVRLNTTWILWVCSQILRFFSLHMNKPQCSFNCSIMIISCGWVCVGAVYFHCWSFKGTDLSRSVSHFPVILTLNHCNTEHSRNYNQTHNNITGQTGVCGGTLRQRSSGPTVRKCFSW